MKKLRVNFNTVTKIYLIAYTCIMIVLCMTVAPHPFGEWDDYSLMTVSVINEGNITVSASDVARAKEMFPSLSAAYDNYSLSGWYAKDGNELAWYAPTYSIVCIPMIGVLKILDIPMEYAFQLTNLALLLGMLWFVFGYKKLDSKIKPLLILLFSISPIMFYITNMTSEVFIYSCISMGMLFWNTKEYKKSAIMIALAGTMNNVILFCGMVMIAEYLINIWKRECKSGSVGEKLKKFVCQWKEIISYGCCWIIGILPMIYFLINTGHINLTAGYSYFTTAADNTFSRFWAYLTDWNFGILPYYNLLLVVAVVLVIVAIVKKNFNYLKKILIFFGVMYLYSIMIHINHGMLGIARYNAWNVVFLIWAVCEFTQELGQEKKKLLYVPICFNIVFLAVVLRVYGFMGAHNTRYTSMTPIAELVLEKAPALYNPLGSTFYSRTIEGIDGGYVYSTPLYYTDKNGNITKILANADDMDSVLNDVTGSQKSIEWLEKKLDGLSEKNSYISISDSKKIQNFVYVLGEDINFSKQANFVTEGLSVDKNAEYSWTDGNHLVMRFRVDDIAYQYVHAELVTAAVYQGEQNVEITVNGSEVLNKKVRTGDNIEFDYPMPDDGIVEIEMNFPDAASPKANNESDDERMLALALIRAKFTGYDENSFSILFAGDNRNADLYVQEGLSGNEGRYAWTDGNRLVIDISKEDMTVKTGDNICAFFALDGIYCESQHVTVKVNGSQVYDGTLKYLDDLHFDFIVAKEDMVRIELEIPDAYSPAEMSTGSDTRKLGLALQNAKFIIRED